MARSRIDGLRQKTAQPIAAPRFSSVTDKPLLTKRFGEALIFAANDLHLKQVLKGGGNIPYMTHLMGVASLALLYGANEDEAIGALLHDAIEDQAEHWPGKAPALRVAIRTRFGPEVLAIVDGCSDTDVIPKPPWKQRKEAYIAHLATASPSVLLVSAADKLYNAAAILRDYRELGDKVFDRFSVPKAQTLWNFRELTKAFAKHGMTPLVRELDRTVTELETVSSKP